MFHITQYFVIASLFMAATSASFVNFQEGLEYNFRVNYTTTVTENDSPTSPGKLFEGHIRVQPVSPNEFYCQGHNIILQDVPYVGLVKTFIIKMNGTKIESITHAANWSTDEVLHVYGIMKGLMKDPSGLTHLLETKDLKNQTGIVDLPLGHCNSDITVIEDGELLKIQAVSTKARCVLPYEVRKILGETLMLLMDDSSNLLLRLTYDRSNMDPKEIFTKVRLRYPAIEGHTDFASELKVTLKNTKEIESKIKLDEELRTITGDEIIALHTPLH